jgi:hypothetical protein
MKTRSGFILPDSIDENKINDIWLNIFNDVKDNSEHLSQLLNADKFSIESLLAYEYVMSEIEQKANQNETVQFDFYVREILGEAKGEEPWVVAEKTLQRFNSLIKFPDNNYHLGIISMW